ncbi:putative coat protein [Linvill Road virus]|nr:putative coat protein [Linvill Road virus]
MNAWIPKYKYLGAGNKLHNGKPYNRTDAIAEQHDWAYERARTPNDIYKADAEAINQFSEEFQRSRTLGALAGEVGLSIKSTADKLAGKPVYPDLPGTKCRPYQTLLSQNQLRDNGMEKSFGISIKIIKRDVCIFR